MVSQSLFPARFVDEPTGARRAWTLRVLRIGSLIQVAFAGLWLGRGALATGWAWRGPLIAVFALTALVVAFVGTRATGGVAPRPSGPSAAAIERAVTIATIVQLAASFALPVVVSALGRPDLVLPVVVGTVGVLLLWFRRRLDVPRYGLVGVALSLGPVALAVALQGDALTASTGLVGGVILLATAALGLRDLQRESNSPDASPRAR